MKTKRLHRGKAIITMLLFLCIVTVLMPIGTRAEGEMPTQVSDAQAFTDAITSGDDIQITEDFILGSIEISDYDGTIDLNGHTITTSGTITIDSASNITLVNRSTTDDGMIIRNHTAALFSVAGELTIGDEENTMETILDGGVVWGAASSSILGETTLERSKTAASGITDATTLVLLYGTLNLNENGALQNVLANNISGGAISVNADGTFNMTGGEIRNCSVTPGSSGGNGGAINVGGIAYISGGSIYGCFSTRVASGFSSKGGSGGAIYIADGMLVMTGGTLHNNVSGGGGGAIAISLSGDSRAIIDGGTITYNETIGGSAYGGGGAIQNNRNASSQTPEFTYEGKKYICELLILSGEISHNTDTRSGGGIMSDGTVSTTLILGGTISYNTSRTGGGVHLKGSANNVIENAVISNNTATANGGGLSTAQALTVKNATFSENSAATSGGGIYCTSENLSILGNTVIKDNVSQGTAAGNGGGGIYTNKHLSISVAKTVAFSGNTAVTLSDVPTSLSKQFPNIQYKSLSVANSFALNNYDINYPPLFTLTYHKGLGTGNAGSGTGPEKQYAIPAGELVISENTFIPPEGKVFKHWNTTYNDSGIVYLSGDTYIMPDANVTLYAIYGTTYTLTYDPNGGTGGSSEEIDPQDNEITVKNASDAGSVTRSGYKFLGWADDKDATAAQYKAGDTITITADKTLFAIWKKNSPSVPDLRPDPEPETPDPETPDPENPDPEIPDPENPDPETPDPETPDPETPKPKPNKPGNTIQKDEDGGFFELDSDGTPLGKWEYDEEEGWVYTPIGDIPQTGNAMTLGLLLLSAGFILLGLVLGGKKRYQNKR